MTIIESQNTMKLGFRVWVGNSSRTVHFYPFWTVQKVWPFTLIILDRPFLRFDLHHNSWSSTWPCTLAEKTVHWDRSGWRPFDMRYDRSISRDRPLSILWTVRFKDLTQWKFGSKWVRLKSKHEKTRRVINNDSSSIIKCWFGSILSLSWNKGN